jgi:hypothetical protein
MGLRLGAARQDSQCRFCLAWGTKATRPAFFTALHRMTLSDEVERALGRQLERIANRKG